VTSTTCPSGTGRLGQGVFVPVGQAQHRVSTVAACPNWDWERSKETSPCPMGQVIYPRWRPFLAAGPGTSSIPTMELVPVPLVPTCPTKWVYKAVELFSLFSLIIIFFPSTHRPQISHEPLVCSKICFSKTEPVQ